MQADKAKQLRKEWQDKGNLPCSHLNLDKEYMLGMDTGDKVCTTCGKIFTPPELKKDSPNE